ncbi:hypothetical protein MTO96_041140, partial [Rhipicephalus appendiculatus]
VLSSAVDRAAYDRAHPARQPTVRQRLAQRFRGNGSRQLFTLSLRHAEEVLQELIEKIRKPPSGNLGAQASKERAPVGQDLSAAQISAGRARGGDIRVQSVEDGGLLSESEHRRVAWLPSSATSSRVVPAQASLPQSSSSSSGTDNVLLWESVSSSLDSLAGSRKTLRRFRSIAPVHVAGHHIDLTTLASGSESRLRPQATRQRRDAHPAAGCDREKPAAVSRGDCSSREKCRRECVGAPSASTSSGFVVSVKSAVARTGVGVAKLCRFL